MSKLIMKKGDKMKKEDRKEFHKHIQKLSKDLAIENNFILYQRTFLIRIINDIVHIISFDFPPSGMQCYIAIQPLYIPEEIIHFSCGRELNYLNTRLSGLWGREKEKMEEDIKEINYLININALSLFEQVSSPKDLINFINSKNFSLIRCAPFLKNLYLGFSYLMIKDYEQAMNPLTTALDIAKGFTGIYKDKNENLLTDIIDKLLKRNFISIDESLKEYIKITKENCKLTDI